MVDRVIGSRQVHEDSTGDQAILITIFDVLRQIQWLAGTRFSWTKSGLFWNEFRIHAFCFPVRTACRCGRAARSVGSSSQRMYPFWASVVPLH